MGLIPIPAFVCIRCVVGMTQVLLAQLLCKTLWKYVRVIHVDLSPEYKVFEIILSLLTLMKWRFKELISLRHSVLFSLFCVVCVFFPSIP
jgi:hypothetical protein